MKTVTQFLIMCILGIALFAFKSNISGTVYLTKTGWVKFTSEAPLELINAENKNVSAVLDIEKKSLAFKVPIVSFQGFNSALQHEHFNENYMEMNVYPAATFTGKIIEDIDFSVAGTYKVRAKGMLSVHGVEKERIISGTIAVKSSSMEIKSNFEVPLSDHDITIPKIVNQKIAEVIQVELKAELKP